MPQDTFELKHKEAQWKHNISTTHKLWCRCPDWRGHFTWLGYRATSGSQGSLATFKAENEPFAEGTITGSGGTQDAEEAIAAAISFAIDEKE